MRITAVFGAKTPKFSKCMMSPHGKGELSQCRHFADKGGGEGGQFFSILCGRI